MAVLVVTAVLCAVVVASGETCTRTGATCVFPFKYSGDTYNECSSVGSDYYDADSDGDTNDGCSWCGTAAKIGDGSDASLFGTCTSCAPKGEKATGAPAGSICTSFGVRCHFPFTYKGVAYDSCTQKDTLDSDGDGDYSDGNPWCGTSANVGDGCDLAEFGDCRPCVDFQSGSATPTSVFYVEGTTNRATTPPTTSPPGTPTAVTTDPPTPSTAPPAAAPTAPPSASPTASTPTKRPTTVQTTPTEAPTTPTEAPTATPDEQSTTMATTPTATAEDDTSGANLKIAGMLTAAAVTFATFVAMR